MRRMLVVAVAASLLGAAWADDPKKRAPGGEPAASAGKAAEARKKEKGTPDQGPRASSPEPKGEARPDRPKPCEPVRPCPID